MMETLLLAVTGVRGNEGSGRQFWHKPGGTPIRSH